MTLTVAVLIKILLLTMPSSSLANPPNRTVQTREDCDEYIASLGRRVARILGSYIIDRGACCLEYDSLHNAFEIFLPNGCHAGEHSCADRVLDPCTMSPTTATHSMPNSTTHSPRSRGGCNQKRQSTRCQDGDVRARSLAQAPSASRAAETNRRYRTELPGPEMAPNATGLRPNPTTQLAATPSCSPVQYNA